MPTFVCLSVWCRCKMKFLYLILIIVLQKCVIPETCAEEIIYINVTYGENVTLQLPERGIKQDIIDVTWVTADWNHFATTLPDGEVRSRDVHYDGRLRGSTDSSLTIINVTSGDQGLYTANVLPTDYENYIHIYNLSILEKSPDPVGLKSSMVDVCSVTCRKNGISVKLTCDQTSHQDITMYDPDTCTCTAWKEDCAPCALDKYCRKVGYTSQKNNLVVPLTVTVVVIVAVTVVLVFFHWLMMHKRFNKILQNFRTREKAKEPCMYGSPPHNQ